MRMSKDPYLIEMVSKELKSDESETEKKKKIKAGFQNDFPNLAQLEIWSAWMAISFKLLYFMWFKANACPVCNILLYHAWFECLVGNTVGSFWTSWRYCSEKLFSLQQL